ncbi:MAG: VOC family protein [Cyanobacteria bacterium P01_G01_bin.67]
MATRNFFVDILGFQQLGEVPDYPAIFLSDGTLLLTLWSAADPDNATPFNRKHNIGLHHFALKVENLAALQSIHQTLLNTPGVEIEFPPESLNGMTAQHMMFYIPGGIRMELIALES